MKGIIILILIVAVISSAVTYIAFVAPYQVQIQTLKDKIQNMTNTSSSDSSVTITASLTPTPDNSTNIKLYYYNESEDKKMNKGKAVCDPKAVLSVDRTLDTTIKPITQAVNLFLKGELTDEEKKNGFVTSLPDAGFSLKDASLDSGTLTLSFEDKNNFTSGKNCDRILLKDEIEKTASQFDGVDSVVFKPNTLF